MSNEVRIRVTAEDKASKPLSEIGKIAAGVFGGAMVLRAFDSFTSGLKSISVGSIKASSDFNENLNKVRVVFRESARDIEAFAKSASTNLGLSQSAALGAAGTFGNLFTAMKLSRPVAADMSQGIIKLAADLASFNNIRPEEALEKLRAGLVGEVEPLRVLGVNLSAVTIAQRAMTLGLAANEKALTPAIKAQAAYSIILEQTQTAQGDFARTSDGLANRQRILTATFADFRTELGSKLEPTVNRILGDLLRTINDPAFVGGVNKWTEAITQFVLTVQTGFSATVIPAFKWIIDNQGALIAAITALGVALAVALGPASIAAAGLVASLAAAGSIKQEQDTGKKGVAGNALSSFLHGTLGKIPFFGENLFEKIVDRGDEVRNTNNAVAEAAEAANEAMQGAAKALDAGLTPALTEMGGAATKAKEQFKTFADFLHEGMGALASAAGAIFGRPSREEATLQLQLAEVERQITGIGMASGPGNAARTRQIDHLQSEIRKLEIDGANARNDAQKAAVEREIESRENAIRALEEGANAALAPYEKLRDQLQSQLTLMEQDNRIQQLQLTLADQTLLSELNQYNMTQDLITQTGRVTGGYRDLADRFGMSIIPGFDELMQKVNGLAEVLAIIQGYGFNPTSFERKIESTVRDSIIGGGFRGVIATP